MGASEAEQLPLGAELLAVEKVPEPDDIWLSSKPEPVIHHASAMFSDGCWMVSRYVRTPGDMIRSRFPEWTLDADGRPRTSEERLTHASRCLLLIPIGHAQASEALSGGCGVV